MQELFQIPRWPERKMILKPLHLPHRAIRSFSTIFGLSNMPMVTTPETLLPVVQRANPLTEHARRLILVRRNSNGGVVGAHSLASDVNPLLDPSQLRSNTLLSILKSSPTILNNLLSHHLTFEMSTRQNTQANCNDHFFPCSATLGMSLR